MKKNLKLEYIINSIPLSQQQKNDLINSLYECIDECVIDKINESLKSNVTIKNKIVLLKPTDNIDVVIDKVNELINFVNKFKSK